MSFEERENKYITLLIDIFMNIRGLIPYTILLEKFVLDISKGAFLFVN
jgi:hypothetical protein